MNDYIIYTDGAYSSSKDKGGIGIVIIKDDKVILEYEKGYDHVTNNKMELAAVITALSCIKNKIDSVQIISDSQYVIYSVTKGWKRKKNKKLWRKFDEVENKVKREYCPNIIYKWVKGHADSIYNIKADELATSYERFN